jgi:hypothetical protein
MQYKKGGVAPPFFVKNLKIDTFMNTKIRVSIFKLFLIVKNAKYKKRKLPSG